jgi:hypothetical protein
MYVHFLFRLQFEGSTNVTVLLLIIIQFQMILVLICSNLVLLEKTTVGTAPGIAGIRN